MSSLAHGYTGGNRVAERLRRSSSCPGASVPAHPDSLLGWPCSACSLAPCEAGQDSTGLSASPALM